MKNFTFVFRTCTVLSFALFFFSAYSQVDVLTQHNDVKRTGWNNQETSLTTSNVNTSSFGLLYSRAVDDQIYAQPLVVSGVSIPSVGTKNVIYVCTVNNTVYAFDADDSTVSAYWQVNYTPSGYRPPLNTDMHPGLCGGSYYDFQTSGGNPGKIGIVGTPVIDKSSNTMYFVTKIVSTTPGVEDNHAWNSSVSNEEYTYTSTGFYQYLHAVDLSTGAEKFNGPVAIADTLSGTGDGNVSGMIPFDPRRQFNRGGLLLSQGILYIPFAAHCDWDPYHGWLIAYDPSTLQLKFGYMSTPNDGRGGIWMSGAGPAVDSLGNIYFSTGNGYDDGTHYTDNPSVTVNRGESVIKLTPNANDNTATAVSISSYFTPYNYQLYNDDDLDFPIQSMVIPNSNLLLTGCKDNNMYLLNRSSLGGFNTSSNNVLQQIAIGNGGEQHASFAYFGGATNQYVYQFAEYTSLKSYKVWPDSLGTPIVSSISGPTGSSGAYMSVSSNGTDASSAILWISHAVNGCNANSQICPGILHAVRADDVTTELWNSNIRSADNLGNFAKMTCPTIANGKVYVNTFSNQLMVYGLESNSTCDTFPNIASSVNNTNATYSASSTASGSSASNAFDGSTSTSWTALSSGTGGGNTAYLTVDLGAKYDICKVIIYWGSNYGTAFNIQGSNDGTTYTTISSVTSNASSNSVITFSTTSYQYIRMQGVTRESTGTGYVINEMEVYGQLSNPCTTPTGLSASNITQNTATLSWQPVSGATSYIIQYKTSLVTSWITRTTTSTSINISALSCNTGYTYEVQAVCASGTSAEATGIFTTSSCTASCGPLPTRYYNADIGDIGVAGSSCYNNGIYTLQGSGTDIGGTSDEFQYAFTNLSGDEHVIAEVLTQDATSPGNKVGLMFRDSTSNTSPFAYIATTSGDGIVFEYRSTSGGSTTTVTVPGITAPYWLEINKSGTQYSAYVSATGATNSWVQVGSTVDLGFGSPSYVGMAITSNNNSVLSTATIGNYEEITSPLLVKLISFTGGNINNQYVLLKWSTSQEVNSKYFSVQRSYNGTDFEEITRVSGSGNSSIVQNYSAYDYHPINGTNFYRLQEVDNDGTVFYSNIVKVNFGNMNVPQVFPNPANSYITVTAGEDAMDNISIFDASGKTILQVVNTNNASAITIPLPNMTSGVYVVKVTTANNVYEQKLFKQ